MNQESRGYWWAFDTLTDEMAPFKSGEWDKLDRRIVSFFGSINISTPDDFDRGALRGLKQGYELIRNRWLLGYNLRYHVR